MPPLEAVLAFTVAAVLLALTPGPSVLFVVGRSIARGRRVGVLSALCADAGVIVLVLLIAFGVGAIISASEVAYWALKIGGALYLMFLGVQAIRHRRRDTDDQRRDRASHLGIALQSFTVGITNPKTLAFLTAILPQFAVPSAGPMPLQILVFGAVYCLIVMTVDVAWALASGSARDWFAKSPRRREHLATSGGVLMVVMGGVLLVGKRA